MIHIKDKSDCCGCTACANICAHNAIVMQRDVYGFQYPIVDEDKCINCRLCEITCPLNNEKIKLQIETKEAFGLYNKDVEKHKLSSSGGVFEELSHFIVQHGGVVYGVVYDTDWIVCHKRIDNILELNEYRGSKYVQSDLRDVFQTVYSDLKSNRKVLFSGTPCQIAGLKSFLRKDYENLVTCEIICHGVPSPLLFKDYISFIQKTRKKLIACINMKDKTNGWGYQSLKIVYKDGSKEQGTLLTNLWNRIYYSNKALRPSCYSCKFTDYSRCADITIGDYWNLNRFHPEIYNKNGVSLILIQTLKGIDLFNCIKDSFLKIKLNTGEYPQESLESPIKIPSGRNLFWQDYFDYGFVFISKKYYGYENKKLKLFIRSIKNIIKIK